MMRKINLFIIAFFLCGGCQGKLKVTVLYETLCLDSVRFIQDQLYYTWLDIGNYFTLQMVPFGKASASYINDTWSFFCHHGSRECYANKIQSCVIHNNLVEDSIEFINCVELGEPSNDTTLRQCCEETTVSWDNIQDCLNTGQGDILLVENGNITEKYIREINNMPAVILNDKYDREIDKEAMYGFKRVVCRNLGKTPNRCQELIG